MASAQNTCHFNSELSGRKQGQQVVIFPSFDARSMLTTLETQVHVWDPKAGDGDAYHYEHGLGTLFASMVVERRDGGGL